MTTPITLCGFAVSNYYNKVKLSLLEKGVPFAEAFVMTSQKEEMLAESPMGKVPFLRTAKGVLSESQVLTEFIEDSWPEPPLYPRDAFERAKCRELIEHLELHIELPARRLYAEAFFGGTVSEETKQEVAVLLEKGLKSLARLARFAPFIGGDSFTHADCAAWVHLPLVSQATRKIYGRDFLDEFLPQAKPYIKLIGERPHAQKVNEDRKAGMEAFMSKPKK
ncbi:glutathione S-transferase [Sulfuritalea hydrogenivorans]|uniref:Glutathione S-transferase domain protein n=1 Tax=Sulfuritalea hydrogenivorans sk43H TaxID=1223802 RepID=W0SJC9_9PROT|nr:glutathione S-transferase [Sulfuritalea hydrogenivorans]BAO30168.1 glutathione S-transferase domain protein [Sulfuritalea hydrogenivorans sk43H]